MKEIPSFDIAFVTKARQTEIRDACRSRDVFPHDDRLVVDRIKIGAWIEKEILADLTAPVGQIRSEPDGRRRKAPGGKHDKTRLDRQPMSVGFARGAIDDIGADASRPPRAVSHDPVYIAVGIKLCAGL